MEDKKYKYALLCSILCFAVSSMSFLLIPMSNFNGTQIERILAYMVGILFWFGFITGLAITFILSKIRKKAGYKKHSFPGLMCFFKSTGGTICDFVMLFSLMLLIVVKTTLKAYSFLWILMLSITTFFIFMHSILNGNNYSYVLQKGVKK